VQKIIFESCILQYLVERDGERRERAIKQPHNQFFLLFYRVYIEGSVNRVSRDFPVREPGSLIFHFLRFMKRKIVQIDYASFT
jgi:hypothetical protein